MNTEKKSNETSNQKLRLFVGGLDPTTTKALLYEYLKQFGEIRKIELKKNSKTKLLRGFGFITCKNLKTKQNLLKNQHIFNGRQIDIKESINKSLSLEEKSNLYKNKLCLTNVPIEFKKGNFFH